MSRHTTYPDPVELHSFRELFDRYPNLPAAGRALISDASSGRAQAACWAGVQEHADAHIESELLYEARLEEEWPPPRRHQPSQRSVAATASTAGAVALSSTDPLKRTPPIEYVAAFTSQPVPASRKVCCPLHDESTPSFHVYEDHWHCFGCHATGGVYELASRITGLSTKGPEFLELRRWAAARLLDGRASRHV